MEKLLSLQYDWEHGEIISDAPPRLYELGAVKIALSLWYNETEIEEIFTLRRVQDKIPLLELPQKVAENVAAKVELIGEQLSEFIKLLPSEFSIHNSWSVLKCKIF